MARRPEDPAVTETRRYVEITRRAMQDFRRATPDDVKKGTLFFMSSMNAAATEAKPVAYEVVSNEVGMMRAGGYREEPHVKIRPVDKQFEPGGWYLIRALWVFDKEL